MTDNWFRFLDALDAHNSGVPGDAQAIASVAQLRALIYDNRNLRAALSRLGRRTCGEDTKDIIRAALDARVWEVVDSFDGTPFTRLERGVSL